MVFHRYIFLLNGSNLNNSWASCGVWGLSGCGGRSYEELLWPDPLHCFHSKGFWVRSLHIHPSCQLLVCVEPARAPVFSLSELNPIRQRCVKDSRAQLSSALPWTQSNAIPCWWLSHKHTQITRLRSWPQTDHICELKTGFHCNRPAKILPPLPLSKPHLPPCLTSAFPLVPLVIFLSLHSLSVLLIVLHASSEGCQ